MAVEKIKASMEWRCPHCGLHAKGTITMNSAGMTWLESAWDDHVKACRNKHRVLVKESEIGSIIQAPAGCFCGSPMPWHLFSIGDIRLSHVCENGHGWAYESEKSAKYTGPERNPFAEYDRAQKASN